MKLQLDVFRQIIVLTSGKDTDAAATATANVNAVAQDLYHQGLQSERVLLQQFEKWMASKSKDRFQTMDTWLDYIEADPELFDADRLAFREALHALSESLKTDGSLPAIQHLKRVHDDLGALDDIERQYSKELKTVYARLALVR